MSSAEESDVNVGVGGLADITNRAERKCICMFSSPLHTNQGKKFLSFNVRHKKRNDGKYVMKIMCAYAG